MSENRVRVWTCILYPDDLKKKKINIDDAINNLHIPCLLSPLHNPDTTDKLKLGEFDPNNVRKKHYHLMMSFEGKKSQAIVKSYLYEQFPCGVGCSIPFEVSSPKGLARYFIHLDNPEKQQFEGKWESVKCFGGFKIDDYLEPSSSEKYRYMREMRKFCFDNDIYELSDLMQICDESFPDTWGYVLSMYCTVPMKAFLDSRRYKLEQKMKRERDINEFRKNNKEQVDNNPFMSNTRNK